MTTVVSERYALSLYEVAKAENIAPEMYEALQTVSDLFETYPDYLKVLTTPSIGLPDKQKTVRAVFEGRVHPYLLNFLLLLTEKRRIGLIHEMAEAYRDLYYLEAGICAVTAVTAIPLDEVQMEKLKNKMAGVTGKQIVLKNQVDPSVLGGVLVRVENKQIDDTIKNRLNELTTRLGQIIA